MCKSKARSLHVMVRAGSVRYTGFSTPYRYRSVSRFRYRCRIEGIGIPNTGITKKSVLIEMNTDTVPIIQHYRNCRIYQKYRKLPKLMEIPKYQIKLLEIPKYRKIPPKKNTAKIMEKKYCKNTKNKKRTAAYT